MATSPSVLNYSILKGKVSFKATGANDYRDLGNAPEFELTPEVDKLDHYSSRSGVRSKDRSVVRGETVCRLVMDKLSMSATKSLMGWSDFQTTR